MHNNGILTPPEELVSSLKQFSDAVLRNFLTPRQVPFTLLSNLTANEHLLRVADLYAYDFASSVSWTSVRTIETEISTRLREMPVHGT